MFNCFLFSVDHVFDLLDSAEPVVVLIMASDETTSSDFHLSYPISLLPSTNFLFYYNIGYLNALSR